MQKEQNKPSTAFRAQTAFIAPVLSGADSWKQDLSGLAKSGGTLAIFAAVLWGVSGTFGQFMIQQKQVNVEWIITVRMLTAGVILLVISFFNPKSDMWRIWRSRRDSVQLVIFGLTGMLAVQYTFFLSIKHSNAATATILQYGGPVLIAIYLAMKNRHLPRPVELLAIALAVAGTFLLVTHGDIHSLSISRWGFVVGVASAFALAVYTLQPEKLLANYSSIAVVGWAMLLGGVTFSFVKAPWEVEGIWDNQTFAALLFLVVLGTLFAFYAYLTAVKMIGGQKSSLLASAEPLSASVVAVLWLQVPFQWVDWLGTAFIVSTIFLLGYRKAPPGSGVNADRQMST